LSAAKDEAWAAKVRFEYADLTHSAVTPGKEGYQHAFDSGLQKTMSTIAKRR
jgi:hypothetical protein